MNDEFLYQLREPLRPRFAEALYTNISNRNRTETVFATSLKRLIWALVVACLIFIFTLALSPNVQAAVLKTLRNIGGIGFDVTDQYPGGGQEGTAPEEMMTLEEARAALPFPVALPTWIPEGYQIVSQVDMIYFHGDYTPVRISWERSNTLLERTLWIDLYIAQPITMTHIVGPASLREVSINGQSATFVDGAWNANTEQWNHENGKELIWRSKQATYRLRSAVLSDEEMIRIAESIP